MSKELSRNEHDWVQAFEETLPPEKVDEFRYRLRTDPILERVVIYASSRSKPDRMLPCGLSKPCFLVLKQAGFVSNGEVNIHKLMKEGCNFWKIRNCGAAKCREILKFIEAEVSGSSLEAWRSLMKRTCKQAVETDCWKGRSMFKRVFSSYI